MRRLPPLIVSTAVLVCWACSAGPPIPEHFVLITLDTVRADRIGAYGRSDAGTPWLDAMADRGTRVERAYTSAPITLPAHVSILTGRYPSATNIHLNGETEIEEGAETTAEILSRNGFFTIAAVGGYPVAGRFPTRRGFEVYDDHLRVGTSGEALERPASMVVDAALAALPGRGSRRLFLWVHFFDAHDPYDPPPPFRDRYAGDAYQGEIAFVDSALATLAMALERALGRDHILWMIVGDHGESLGEHGEDTHGYFLYEATLRVPFLLAGPGVPAGHVAREPARTVDLLPTALARLGVPVPAGLDGRTLLEEPDPQLEVRVYAETRLPAAHYGFAPLRSAIDGTIKYIDAPRPEIYELHTDPSETRNVVADHEEDASRLAAWLSRFGGGEGRPLRIDPRLAALGYVGAGPTSTDRAIDPKDGLPIYRDFQSASRALETGQPERAIRALDRLLARKETAPLRFKRAQALRMSGRLLEARAELERARGMGVGLPGLHLEAARIAAALKDWPRTVREAEAHLREDPGSAAALLFRGAGREMTGQTQGAESDYRSALAVDGRYRDASLRLAALLVRTGRFPDARTVLHEHLRHHPGDALAAGLLGAL